MVILNGYIFILENRTCNHIISSNKKEASYLDVLKNLKVRFHNDYNFRWSNDEFLVTIYYFYNDGENCKKFESFYGLVNDFDEIINKEIEVVGHPLYKDINFNEIFKL